MPIQDLSVETACEIFILADRSHRFYLPNPLSLPLVVAAVCKSWSNAALACQPLWKFYEISTRFHNGSTFLARAGNSPVHVIVCKGVFICHLYSLFTNRTVCALSFLSGLFAHFVPGALLHQHSWRRLASLAAPDARLRGFLGQSFRPWSHQDHRP